MQDVYINGLIKENNFMIKILCKYRIFLNKRYNYVTSTRKTYPVNRLSVYFILKLKQTMGMLSINKLMEKQKIIQKLIIIIHDHYLFI